MAKQAVTYYVPAGYESQVPGGATRALVAYPGAPGAEPPTHWGGNSVLDDAGAPYGALIGALMTIPGANWTVVPWKQWSNSVNWLGWLATNNLQPQV